MIYTMLLRDLGLLILFHRIVFAEVPDPEKDLVQIANSQSGCSVSLLSLESC